MDDTTGGQGTAGFVTSRDGTRIGYLQQGSGPGVVLVQGAMADAHSYRSWRRPCPRTSPSTPSTGAGEG